MFLLMDIGCICKGQLSRVVGTFEKLSDAQTNQHKCEEKYGLPSGGEHQFRIFEIPDQPWVNDHYEI